MTEQSHEAFLQVGLFHDRINQWLIAEFIFFCAVTITGSSAANCASGIANELSLEVSDSHGFKRVLYVANASNVW